MWATRKRATQWGVSGSNKIGPISHSRQLITERRPSGMTERSKSPCTAIASDGSIMACHVGEKVSQSFCRLLHEEGGGGGGRVRARLFWSLRKLE